MKFKLDERYIQELRDEYLALKNTGASKTELGAWVKGKAQCCGKSHKTLYAKMDLGLRSVTVKQSVNEKWKEIDRYGKLVFDIAASKSRDEARVDWKLTLEALQAHGDIPSHIKLHDIYKSITERQNLPTLSQAVLKQTVRHHPLSLVHIDYSVSRYFKYDPRDHSLVLTAPGGGYYKNDKDEDGKKVKPDRVWFGVIVDQYSRVMFAQYMLRKAESPEMTQFFMQAAFSEKDRLVGNHGEYVIEELFQGMPESIYWDRGPGHTKQLTIDGLKELDVAVISGDNKIDGFGKKTARSNKGAHGIVERTVGLVKQHFEEKIFLMQKQGYKISLNELNDELREWCRMRNLGRHPVMKDQICWNLFQTEITNLRFPPDDFMRFFSGVYSRTVVNRMVQFDNVSYVVPDLAANGKSIDIVKEGETIYASIGGKRYLLEAQSEWHKQHSANHELADDDILTDRELRLRLDDEIKSQSAGELWLSKMKSTHEDDLKAFYEKERTVEEIRVFAAMLVSERSVRMANIIELPPPEEEK